MRVSALCGICLASLALASCAQPAAEERCTKEPFGVKKIAITTSIKTDEWKPEEVRSLRRGAYYEVGSFSIASATWLILDWDQAVIIEVSRTIGAATASQHLPQSERLVRNGAMAGREWTDKVKRRSLTSQELAGLVCDANRLWLDPYTREMNAIAFGITQSFWLVGDGAYKEFSGTGVIPKPAEAFKTRLTDMK